MFEYYTALLLITSSVIFSALTVIYFDVVLEKFNKAIFIFSYFAILFSSIVEWIILYLVKNNSSMHNITAFSTALVLFIAPSMVVVLAWGIDDTKSKIFTKIVMAFVALNFIIAFSGLFTNSIFYYDELNTYHRGKYHILYFIMVIIAMLILFVNSFKLGVKYQNKNNYILALNFIMLLVGILSHYFLEGARIIWISLTISITLIYIYYCSLVNQVDVLTGILNRKCFDSQLYVLKTEAIILFFDVNKFKEINDTAGHAVGDYCLVEIANAIKKVYGRSGFCYRIGGDEFSVILYKNLDSLERLNSKFKNRITTKKYKHELPNVSIGYSYYYPDKSSIQKVMEEADSMMYANKLQNK